MGELVSVCERTSHCSPGSPQRVSNNLYGCRAFIAALFGRFSFEAHDTVSDGKLCERANPGPPAQQLWQEIQGLKEVDQGECFLLLLEDRIMDMF